MRFRLIYEGDLKPSQLDPLTGNPDKLAGHKQTIRKAFHGQIKRLWTTNRFLSPLADAVAADYHEYGYIFIPLVLERWSLRCAINVLLLRQDFPGSGVIAAGDLDNRIKTLIDGLRRPKNGVELREHPQPADGETPFYCLLEDDSQITELTVETDTLLDVPEGADQRYAKAIVTVEIQPYNVTMFNLAFA